MIDTGEVKNQADLARKLGVSRVRISQVLSLLKLDDELIIAVERFGEHESLENELLALPAVVIFMAVLVLHHPFAKADDQNSERLIFGPEAVPHTGVHYELFVGFGLVDFAVDLQKRPIVDEVEELGADLVRVETRSAAGLHVR